MDSDIHKKFGYFLLLLVSLSCSVDAVPCPRWYSYRRCQGRPCTVVRDRYGYSRYDCLSYEEAELLQRALRGGATGPGTGIGESLRGRPNVANILDQLELHININNDNNNQIQQTDSGNVAVSQVQAQLSPETCQSCQDGSGCTPPQICVATSTCPGITLSCRSITG